ncbi:site-2 protease family protein [Spirulina major CS-329]|uniref:site-2 protease family protein n=1 Tax=Spirulina TaxID=1154 RepID=UPI00232C3479|nr:MULTISPECIES: site-2 protease family protein [Spirulina]MDB9493494.1 site-2 protease family protein [Spirulina subsalsa CS-330]MDB9502587.1 site-2 protease family protein [Spirulina major CS-329]
MFSHSEAIATLAIIAVASGFLIWGYNRAKPYGKLGVLAWLQSVVLIAPWLVFFGLVALGVYINFVLIILLLVGSSGVYIYLGNRLRAEGQDEIIRQRAAQRLAAEAGETAADGSTPSTALNLEPDTSPIPVEDLQTIKGIFGIDTFFATETIAYQDGAIFRGNLRGEPDTVYDRLSTKLTDLCGEQYRLFLVESPDGKPIVIVLPSRNDPQPMTLGQKNLAIVLLVATLATSIEAASLLLGFDWFSDLGRYLEPIPIALGLWIILGAHEFGHWFYAQRYNIKLSWPFFLPSWQIGTFGSITRFESLVPHRSALFDVAIAGPALGGLLSFLMLMTGLVLSHPGSLFKLPTQFFQGSILVGTLAKTILGSQLENAIVDIHPLTVIGWLGLVITALNLMPAGQLDGGRIVQAIYGRKTARRTTIATLVVLGIVAIFNAANPIPLYWGIVILFVQRDLERPSLNELTEPNDARAALGLLALFLMLATLIPLSPGLAGRLGIG